MSVKPGPDALLEGAGEERLALKPPLTLADVVEVPRAPGPLAIKQASTRSAMSASASERRKPA